MSTPVQQNIYERQTVISSSEDPQIVVKGDRSYRNDFVKSTFKNFKYFEYAAHLTLCKWTSIDILETFRSIWSELLFIKTPLFSKQNKRNKEKCCLTSLDYTDTCNGTRCTSSLIHSLTLFVCMQFCTSGLTALVMSAVFLLHLSYFEKRCYCKQQSLEYKHR